MKLALLIPLVVLLTAVPAAHSYAAKAPPGQLVAGKKIYGTYCQQCHVLYDCLCAGFGGSGKFGADGGPDFRDLKLPYNITITAVYGGSAGHERVLSKVSWQEVHQVALFIAVATKNHPLGIRQPPD